MPVCVVRRGEAWRWWCCPIIVPAMWIVHFRSRWDRRGGRSLFQGRSVAAARTPTSETGGMEREEVSAGLDNTAALHVPQQRLDRLTEGHGAAHLVPRGVG